MPRAHVMRALLVHKVHICHKSSKASILSQEWGMLWCGSRKPVAPINRQVGAYVITLPIDMLNEHKDTRLPGSSRLCGGGKARDVLPGVESLSHHLTVFGGGEEVTSRAEVLGDGPIGREE